jgi:hypothetical protein
MNPVKPNAVTIPFWHLALFVVLVPIALYVLIPISGSLTAGFAVLYRRHHGDLSPTSGSGSEGPAATNHITQDG